MALIRFSVHDSCLYKHVDGWLGQWMDGGKKKILFLKVQTMVYRVESGLDCILEQWTHSIFSKSSKTTVG